MMILMTYSISKVLIGILFVTLALLILTIAYRKLIAYWGKGTPAPKDYCVLYSLEGEKAAGEIEIYFTTPSKKYVFIELLNSDMTLNQVIQEKEFIEGGNIVRFDTRVLADGSYFYCLRTDNQKTMKKFLVSNG